MNKFWAKFWACIIVVLLLGVVLSFAHGWAEAYLKASALHRAPKATFDSPQEAGLRASMSLGRSPILSDKPAALVLRFENQGRLPLRVTLEEMRAFGLRPLFGSSFNLRTGSDRKAALSGHVLDLAPSQQATYTVELLPTETSGSFVISVAGSWQAQNADPAPQAWSLGLEDVQIISPHLTLQAHTINAVITLLGLLAVPVLIALGGAWFQHSQQRSALLQQAWNTMLPVSHKSNTELYLPLYSGTLSALAEYEKVGKAVREERPLPKKSAGRLLFYLLFAAKRRQIISEKGGGYYLASREGEALVIAAMDTGFLYDALREKLSPPEELNQFLQSLEADETLASFYTKVLKAKSGESPHRPFNSVGRVKRRLRLWVTRDQINARWWFNLLDLGQTVLLFEMNRIYEFWYGKNPEFPVKDFTRLVEKLERPPESEVARWEEIRELIEDYEANLIEQGIIKKTGTLMTRRSIGH